MSDLDADIVDPRLALEKARGVACEFAALDSGSCTQELATQLCDSLREMIQITDELLAEKEKFRSRLHRSTTFSIPDNSGTPSAL